VRNGPRERCLSRSATLSCGLLFLAGCAHQAVAPPRPAAAARVWPMAPANPQIRYVGAYPDLDRPPPTMSLWEKIVRAFVGFDEVQSHGPILARPFGVAAVGDRFLVADPDGRQVLDIDWRKNELRRVECPDRPWTMPMAVAATADGTVWVADGTAGVLVRVTPKGCSMIGAGHLERPTGVAVIDGRIYTVDPPRHDVVGFSADGNELVRFGSHGAGTSQFNFPTSIAAGAPGEVLVVDALNFRVARFSTDGRFLGAFGEPGDGGGAFGRPKAVATDGTGRLYVSDAQNDVVIAYDAAGAYRLAFGGSGAAPGALTLPAGLAVGGHHVFVADSQNHRIQIYELLEEAR